MKTRIGFGLGALMLSLLFAGAMAQSPSVNLAVNQSSITAGQSVNFSINVTDSIAPPYVYSLFNIGTNSIAGCNTLTVNSITGNARCIFTPSGSSSYNITVGDSNTIPDVFNSIPVNISVYSAPSPSQGTERADLPLPPIPPTITATANGWNVSNLVWYGSFQAGSLNGEVNYITPTSLGLTLNGESYYDIMSNSTISTGGYNITVGPIVWNNPTTYTSLAISSASNSIGLASGNSTSSIWAQAASLLERIDHISADPQQYFLPNLNVQKWIAEQLNQT